MTVCEDARNRLAFEESRASGQPGVDENIGAESPHEQRVAGASQLDLDAWRAGRLALDPEQAERVADAEIEASPTLTGSASADGEEVSVELRESFPTMALRLVGIPELEVVARAEASPEAP